MIGNQNLVRVAVAREPHEATPLHGTWIGSASDHLAMKVTVKVMAADVEPAPACNDDAGLRRTQQLHDRSPFWGNNGT
jgi:hypothetical protein